VPPTELPTEHEKLEKGNDRVAIQPIGSAPNPNATGS
jgi:hypothetical protein